MFARLFLAIGAVSACFGAAAQTPAYDSAFAGYKAYTEPQLASWRETNDKIGNPPGYAGHAMAPVKAVEAARTGPDPHAGHDMGAHKEIAKPAAPVKAKADPHAAHKH